MPPPRARDFTIGHLGAFDDHALRVFLRPGPAGIEPTGLGIAAQGAPDGLVQRLREALPLPCRPAFDTGRAELTSTAAVERERLRVVDRLFWPLLYWHAPGEYEDLVRGERIHTSLLAAIPVAGRQVCDAGAGAGRFTRHAAQNATHVVAVDEVPPLLERLERHLAEEGLANVEVRRGSLDNLPLETASVDTAVACSSLTSEEPFGGEAALRELERVVRPGGTVAVVWPDRPEWFVARGYQQVRGGAYETVRFADAGQAERVCASFYSDAAAAWVRHTGAAEVPYAVLGMTPPDSLCVRQMPRPGRSPLRSGHPGA